MVRLALLQHVLDALRVHELVGIAKLIMLSGYHFGQRAAVERYPNDWLDQRRHVTCNLSISAASFVKELPFLGAVGAIEVVNGIDRDQELARLQRLHQRWLPLLAELDLLLVQKAGVFACVGVLPRRPEEARIPAARHAVTNGLRKILEKLFQIRIVVCPGVAEEELITHGARVGTP